MRNNRILATLALAALAVGIPAVAVSTMAAAARAPAGPMAAAAAPTAYPPPGGTPVPTAAPAPPVPAAFLAVFPGTVTVGETVTVTGTNFTPGETVTIDVTYQPTGMRRPGARTDVVPAAYLVPQKARLPQQARRTTVTASSSGGFTADVQLTQTGTATITATGAQSGRSASATVRVLAEGTAMPVTGDNHYLGLALIGSAIAAAGVLLAVLARSRRRPTVADDDY